MLPVHSKPATPTKMHLQQDDDISLEFNQTQTQTPDYKSTMKDIQYFSKQSQMSNIIEDILLEKKKNKFIDKISTVLQTIQKLNLKDEKQLQNLFLFVLQSAEDYIYTPNTEKCTLVKNNVCIELLKQFVKNDIKLCQQIIAIVESKIKKSTLLRRNKKRLIRCFFFFLERACLVR